MPKLMELLKNSKNE